MNLLSVLLPSMILASSVGHAALVETPLPFKVGEAEFASVLIHDEGKPATRAILLTPNWMGINAANLRQARGYTVYVVDMYGKDIRPTNSTEAGKAADAVKDDTPALRARINQALATLLAQKQVAVDPKRIGAIGFCFGGTVSLELARSGAAIASVVSFHGGLSTEQPASADSLKAKVLVLHGADDPYVPATQVDALVKEMRAAKADWQLVSFGNAVHSFTDVDAKLTGEAEYNADVARRAYAMMDGFFGETLGAP